MPRAAADRQTCVECGGSLRFDVGAGTAVCSYCGAAPGGGAPVAASGAALPLPAALRCTGCGAGIALDPRLIAAECPFCRSALVRRDLPDGDLAMPTGVVPFALDQRAAVAAVTDFLSELRLPKRRVREIVEGLSLSGVFLPAFVFDIEVAASVSRDSSKLMVLHRTQHVFDVSGRIEDIVVPACDTLGPYGSLAMPAAAKPGLNALAGFRPDYLAGFRAALPTIGADPALERAEPLVAAHCDALAAAKLVTWSERPHWHTAIERRAVRSRLVFLPVWLGTYRSDGQDYRVWVDGQDGTARAECPAPRDGRIAITLFGATWLIVLLAGVIGILAA